MKILLVQKFSIVEPIGLMTIGNAMIKSGYDINYHLYKGKKIEFDQDITKYDLIGFGTYTGNHLEVYECCDYLKKIGIKTAIGGPHTTYFYDECKIHSDYVFRGESVISFPEMNDKKIYPLVDPNSLIPDRTVFYNYSEIHKNNKIKSMMTSFGCPFSCSYCYNSLIKQIYGNIKVRLRSVDSVIEEAKNISCDLIYFQDDFFGYNEKWLKEFHDKWNKRPYHAQLRIETINDKKIDLLTKSGCNGVTIAIEVFSEEYRRTMLKRNMTNEAILTNCKKILDNGLKLRTQQMLGLPNTTFEDELKLLKFNCEINPTIAWTSIFQPYRGTELGEYCLANKLYAKNNEDLPDSFFNESRLNFSDERKRQILKLHEIFSMCSHLPNGWDYAFKIINENDENLKNHLYSVLYDVKAML